VELVDCRNVLAETDGPRISVIGLEGIAVVVDGDEVLVTTMAGAQKVGKLGGAVNQ
jgi:mannose-1-phosphate guanylyltransferase